MFGARASTVNSYSMRGYSFNYSRWGGRGVLRMFSAGERARA